MSDIDLKALRKGTQHAQAYSCMPMAIHPDDMMQLLDRLESAERRAEEAEKECAEQARLVGMGAERELDLMAKLGRAEKERDALRKDAERYRWLRTPPNNLRTEVYGAPALEGLLRRDVYLDASIDAAMAQEGGK